MKDPHIGGPVNPNKPCYIDGPVDPDKPSRKIRLQFAQEIRQVSASEIEVEVVEADFPPFTDELVKHVHSVMGTNKGEVFLNDKADEILQQMILARVSLR